MAETERALAEFHELDQTELEEICQNRRAFTEAVKMVAAADMTNFTASSEAGQLVLSALCHASQMQHVWYKARIILHQVRDIQNVDHLEIVKSRCSCKLGYC